MAELRRLFGLLRSDESPSLEPQPGLAQISELTDALSAAGVRATIHLDDDLDLPAGVDLAAYRIVQEATTNILPSRVASRPKLTGGLGSTPP